MISYYKQTYYVLIGLSLLLLPFHVWQNVFVPAVAGKILFGAWTIIILLVAGGLLQIVKKEQTINITLIDGLCITYSFYFLIRMMISPVGPDRLKTLEYVVVAAFYIVFRSLDQKGLFLVGIFIILAAVGQSVYGIAQVIGLFAPLHTQFNTTGSFFNPGPYAGYIACMIPVMIGSFYLSEQRIGKKLLMAGTVVVLTALVLSESRAAWLGVLAGSAWILWKQYYAKLGSSLSRTGRLTRAMIIMSISCLLIAGGVALYLMKKPSANGRLLIWNNTCSLIADYPLLGVGIGQFKAHYMNYQARYFERTLPASVNYPADNSVYAFNEYLESASEQGIIGLLLFAGIIVSAFVTKRYNNQQITTLARAGLLCILIFACFSYPFDILPIKIHIAFFIAAVAFCQQPVKIISPGKVFTVTCCVILCLLAYPAGRYIQSTTRIHATWEKAFRNFQQQKPEPNLKLCAEIAPYLEQHGVFQTMYGQMLTWSNLPGQAIPVLEQANRLQPGTGVWMNLGENYKKQGDYAMAETAYRKAWLMIPSRIQPCCLLARLYMETGRTDEAIALIEETLLRWKTRKHSMDTYAVQWEMEAMLKKLKTGTQSETN